MKRLDGRVALISARRSAVRTVRPSRYRPSTSSPEEAIEKGDLRANGALQHRRQSLPQGRVLRRTYPCHESEHSIDYILPSLRFRRQL